MVAEDSLRRGDESARAASSNPWDLSSDRAVPSPPELTTSRRNGPYEICGLLLASDRAPESGCGRQDETVCNLLHAGVGRARWVALDITMHGKQVKSGSGKDVPFSSADRASRSDLIRVQAGARRKSVKLHDWRPDTNSNVKKIQIITETAPA